MLPGLAADLLRSMPGELRRLLPRFPPLGGAWCAARVGTGVLVHTAGINASPSPWGSYACTPARPVARLAAPPACAAGLPARATPLSLCLRGALLGSADARSLGPTREAPGAEERTDADRLAELGPGPEASEGARRLREPPGADGASPGRAYGLSKGPAEDSRARAADGARRFRELLGEEEDSGSGGGRFGGDGGYAAGARSASVMPRAGCSPGARPGADMWRLQAAAARRGAMRGLPLQVLGRCRTGRVLLCAGSARHAGPELRNQQTLY